MNLRTLKEKLYEIVSIYFQGATVIWAEQHIVKPILPLITLKTGPLSLPTFSINDESNDVPTGYYPSRVSLEINLYTVGALVESEEGEIGATENTAVNDMMDFLRFINSQHVTELCEQYDIAIMPSGPIQDLTGLLNDTRYQYRAMLELSVDFMQEARGYAGITPETGTWEQTSSGGGSQELADKATGYFTTVAIEEEKEETT